MHSERTIYNYLDYSLFSARNIDLSRKVKYRPRKKQEDRFKVDKACRIGRTYEDFLSFLKMFPDTLVVEMDTVEGEKGGKVLLTIHFTEPQFMLAFIRNANTSRSVINIFRILLGKLGKEEFTRLTYVFYCDPSSP